MTLEYWNATVGGEEVTDIAWSYNFPTIPITPIAGLVAFYDEKVELTVG